MKHCFRFTLLFLLVVWSEIVSALPSYLVEFEALYPMSTSNNAQCQICHVSPGGNSPWNSYGWSLRLRGIGTDIDSRMQNIEMDNSDGVATNNLSEINAGTQPGWAIGNVNRHRNGNGSIVSNQPPPISLQAGVLVDPGATAAPGGPEGDPIAGEISKGDIVINFETIASGFSNPIFIQRLSSENNLYVIERGGQVKRVNLDTAAVTNYLDFDLPENQLEAGGEKGLLGFAFHPDFANNNKVYTYTSETVDGAPDFPTTLPIGENPEHQTVITEWVVFNHVSSPASVMSRRVLMRIDQPQSNHNGGTIEFGPDDYLYIGLGDGGGGNDQGTGHPTEGNSQAFENPLGSILRIDVDGNTSTNGQYGIPTGLSGNPFTGALPGLDEAYAYGFRNPYRFSINDLGGGDFEIYVGDVGQGDIEEVSIINSNEPGGNYGWRLKEGSFFFYDDNAICDGSAPCVSNDPPQGVALPNMLDPIVEYDHDEGVSVIGGHVYKGSSMPELTDLYVFGEYLGRLFYIDQNQVMREFGYQQPIGASVTAIGRDNQGELYFVGGASNGVLRKISQGEIDDELCVPIKAANGNLAIICL